MQTTAPDQVIQLFVKCFTERDLEGLGSLYEPEARVVPEPGQDPITGPAAIKGFFQRFLDMGGTLTILASTSFRAGEIALTHSRWRLETPGAEPMEGVSAEVVRQQPGGAWKYVIDNPWGAGVVTAAQDQPERA